MNATLMSVYSQLPAPARSVAATLRGYYLRHWRNGPEYDAHQEAALDRDHWPAPRLRAWEQERLARILHRAATRVPFYRRQWEQRRLRGDRSSFEYLENWPILEKDAVRAAPRDFIAVDRDPRGLFHEQTSGTTGTPIEIFRSRATLTELYAIAHARTLAWHGIAETARYARFGGQLVVPPSHDRGPFWVWNAAMHQLYMSTYHLAPRHLPSYLGALRTYRIRYLAGYTSSLVPLAHEALREGREMSMAAIFTNAEGVDPWQRSVLEKAFRGPVRETYGQAEMVAAATECPAGRLHLWPEAGIVEVREFDRAAEPGQTGDLICTGLLNPDMPLIRYRIGDRGRLAAPGTTCACGRTLGLLEGIEGRTNDCLLTRDGGRVFWLNPVFYGLALREAQIEQVSLSRIIVRIAPGPGFDTDRDCRAIEERVRQRLGDVTVTFEHVDAVPRTANGKVRTVICRLIEAPIPA